MTKMINKIITLLLICTILIMCVGCTDSDIDNSKNTDSNSELKLFEPLDLSSLKTSIDKYNIDSSEDIEMSKAVYVYEYDTKDTKFEHPNKTLLAYYQIGEFIIPSDADDVISEHIKKIVEEENEVKEGSIYFAKAYEQNYNIDGQMNKHYEPYSDYSEISDIPNDKYQYTMPYNIKRETSINTVDFDFYKQYDVGCYEVDYNSDVQDTHNEFNEAPEYSYIKRVIVDTKTNELKEIQYLNKTEKGEKILQREIYKRTNINFEIPKCKIQNDFDNYGHVFERWYEIKKPIHSA